MNGSSTALTPPIFEALAALAEPTRARLLLLLEQHELTVSELCSVVQLPQSTVSRHLKVLARDEWVTARAEGTSRHYRFSGGTTGSERLWPVVRAEMLHADGTQHDLERVKSVIAERRSRSRAFFSSAAGEWERLRAELFGPRTELHGLLALLNAEWTVGDLGCGTGGLAALVAPFVRQVIAVDDSAAMLDAARQRLRGADNIDLREGVLEALPVEDGALDVALLFLVLHHVSEPVGVLREVRRTLGAGGRVVIVDMMAHQREELRAEMGHVWLGFRPQQLTDWLEEAGMTATRQMPLPAHPGATGPTLFAATAKMPAARAGDRSYKLESELS